MSNIFKKVHIFQGPRNEVNREAGAIPERSRHCETMSPLDIPLVFYWEGREDDDLKPGDLP